MAGSHWQKASEKLRDAGVSTREVGKRFGISHKTIWRLIQNKPFDSRVKYEEESAANTTGFIDSSIDTNEKGSGEDGQGGLRAQPEEEERGR